MNDATRNASIRSTVDHLAARWAAADKGILRTIFPLLAAGSPVPVERITEAAGTTRIRVEAALTAGRAGRDAEGRVVELSGLTLQPTLHRVEVNGVALFGCCALLAHLTTFLLERAVGIESVDPVTRTIVRLAVSPREATALDPRVVSTFVHTDAASVAADVRANLCTHVHHFSTPQAAAEFAAADERRYVLGIAELHRAAEMLYRSAWA